MTAEITEQEIEDARAERRAYMKQYRADHREELNEYLKNWRAANPERVKAIQTRSLAKKHRARREEEG